jgi:hypothetical protein
MSLASRPVNLAFRTVMTVKMKSKSSKTNPKLNLAREFR